MNAIKIIVKNYDLNHYELQFYYGFLSELYLKLNNIKQSIIY